MKSFIYTNVRINLNSVSELFVTLQPAPAILLEPIIYIDISDTLFQLSLILPLFKFPSPLLALKICPNQRQGAAGKGFDHMIGDILFRLIRRMGAPVGFLLVHFASVFSFQGAYQRSRSSRFFTLRRNVRCNSRVSRSFAKISANTSLTRCGASLTA